MLINQLMRIQIDTIDWGEIEAMLLPSALIDIINQGFIKKNGCFLSTKLLSYCNSKSLNEFQDEIAFECFVNSFHMEDYVSEKYFEYSIIFCNSLLQRWSEEGVGKLNVIISLDDETLFPTIKYHLKREYSSWLNEDDLDSSIQAVLITNEIITINNI